MPCVNLSTMEANPSHMAGAKYTNVRTILDYRFTKKNKVHGMPFTHLYMYWPKNADRRTIKSYRME